eukprot:4900609-Amphidinium_carterae.2
MCSDGTSKLKQNLTCLRSSFRTHHAIKSYRFHPTSAVHPLTCMAAQGEAAEALVHGVSTSARAPLLPS